MSETSKHRDKTVQYCVGNGIDIGSGGDPVVPNAIQIDLPDEKFEYYNSGKKLDKSAWRGSGADLPFKDNVCDFVYSSHLLEDFFDWDPILREWVRVLKPGGHLVILVPDKARWNAAIRKGQPPNCEHRHESHVGELSQWCNRLGLTKIKDEFSKPNSEDYTIVFVAKKNA